MPLKDPPEGARRAVGRWIKTIVNGFRDTGEATPVTALFARPATPDDEPELIAVLSIGRNEKLCDFRARVSRTCDVSNVAYLVFGCEMALAQCDNPARLADEIEKAQDAQDEDRLIALLAQCKDEDLSTVPRRALGLCIEDGSESSLIVFPIKEYNDGRRELGQSFEVPVTDDEGRTLIGGSFVNLMHGAPEYRPPESTKN